MRTGTPRGDNGDIRDTWGGDREVRGDRDTCGDTGDPEARGGQEQWPGGDKDRGNTGIIAIIVIGTPRTPGMSGQEHQEYQHYREHQDSRDRNPGNSAKGEQRTPRGEEGGGNSRGHRAGLGTPGQVTGNAKQNGQRYRGTGEAPGTRGKAPGAPGRHRAHRKSTGHTGTGTRGGTDGPREGRERHRDPRIGESRPAAGPEACPGPEAPPCPQRGSEGAAPGPPRPPPAVTFPHPSGRTHRAGAGGGAAPRAEQRAGSEAGPRRAREVPQPREAPQAPQRRHRRGRGDAPRRPGSDGSGEAVGSDVTERHVTTVTIWILIYCNAPWRRAGKEHTNRPRP